MYRVICRFGVLEFTGNRLTRSRRNELSFISGDIHVALSSKTTWFRGEGVHESKRFPTVIRRKAKLAVRRKRIKKTGKRQPEPPLDESLRPFVLFSVTRRAPRTPARTLRGSTNLFPLRVLRALRGSIGHLGMMKMRMMMKTQKPGTRS
jgi:hypothetical protein